jgi:hypothetical protein
MMKPLILLFAISTVLSQTPTPPVATVTEAYVGPDRLRVLQINEFPANSPRVIDIRGLSAGKSSVSGFIDAVEFDLTTINQTALLFQYAFEAVSLPNGPSTQPNAAVAAAFAFALRAFFVFEWENNNGIPGYQANSSDVIIGGYNLSSESLPWKPITVNTTTFQGVNETFKVSVITAETLDGVFLLRFIAAEKPVNVGNVRISPDRIKIDFVVRYYNNPSHVPSAWTTGASDPAAHPNASVGILAFTASKFGVAAFVNGTNTNATGINFGSGGFNGIFNWSPTADTEVSGVAASRAVWVHAVDSTGDSSVNVGWAAGWNFKILFFSFEGFRPNLVFWDPVFGSDIDYAVVDQQANPTAQTSANPTSQSSPNPTQSSANPNSQSSVNPNSQSSANPTAVQSSAHTGSSNGNNSSASTLLTHALLVLVCIMALF